MFPYLWNERERPTLALGGERSKQSSIIPFPDIELIETFSTVIPSLAKLRRDNMS